MATIGTFKTDGATFTGNIETLSLKAKVTFEPAQKKTSSAPDFRIFNVTGEFKSEIGAAWKKSSNERAEYLSASIDDPSFPAKINCRLVKTGTNQGYTLFWDRTRHRD